MYNAVDFLLLLYKIYLSILGLRCYAGVSLVATSGGYLTCCGAPLLIEVASLVAKHGRSSCGAQA